MKKIAIVTGGSSGIGLEITKALIKRNYFVYTISRRNFSQFNTDVSVHFSADVAEETAVKTVIEKIYGAEKHIHLLVCAAGFGISGAAEFTEAEDAHRQVDVNFFGTFFALKTVSGYMRAQGFGRIITVSSVAGEIAIPFQSFYSASKAAVNKFMEAFRAETAPFGISCAVIMPGDTVTPFSKKRKKSEKGDGIYNGRIEKSVSKMEVDEAKGMNAAKLGEFIAAIAEKKRIRFTYPYNRNYGFLLFLYRILPRRFSLYLVKKLYAE